MKKKTEESTTELIRRLIPDVKNGDIISVYNPHSFIVGCYWDIGVWIEDDFILYCSSSAKHYPSDVNLFELDKNACYAIDNDIVTTLHKPRKYFTSDLTEDELYCYKAWKEVKEKDNFAGISDIWELAWDKLHLIDKCNNHTTYLKHLFNAVYNSEVANN